MSYKSELQSNNADLQNILDTINSLPEAGGSDDDSIKTCTVTFNVTHTSPWGAESIDVHYINKNGEMIYDYSHWTNEETVVFEVAEKSIFILENYRQQITDINTLIHTSPRGEDAYLYIGSNVEVDLVIT